MKTCRSHDVARSDQRQVPRAARHHARTPVALALLVSAWSMLLMLFPAQLLQAAESTPAAPKAAATGKAAETPSVTARPDGSPHAGAASEPIRVTSDTLVADNNSRFAEFKGNVIAIQGQTLMKADRLKVFYGDSSANGPKEGNAETSIEKIEAEGHVRITFDNRVAQTEQAVYTPNNRTLVLKGEGSTVTSGANVVTGSEIIYDRNKGQVTIHGGPRKRVEAIIQSDRRGLN